MGRLIVSDTNGKLLAIGRACSIPSSTLFRTLPLSAAGSEWWLVLNSA